MTILYFRFQIADCRFKNNCTNLRTQGQSEICNQQSAITLYRFAVINRLLTLLQRDIRFLPGWFASFKAAASRGLTHEINRSHMINFDLKNRLYSRFDLRLGCMLINPERKQLLLVLSFFLCDQRLLSNHRRLDDVPNCSHRLCRLLFLRFACSLWFGWRFFNCSRSFTALRTE